MLKPTHKRSVVSAFTLEYKALLHIPICICTVNQYIKLSHHLQFTYTYYPDFLDLSIVSWSWG